MMFDIRPSFAVPFCIALSLLTPQLYPSESAHTLQTKTLKQTFELLAIAFGSIQVPGTVQHATEPFTICNTLSTATGTPVRTLTILDDNDRKVLELNGYSRKVIAARKEEDCWILGDEDETVTYLPLTPITCSDLEHLTDDQLTFITEIDKRSQKQQTSLRLTEAQTKLYATLSSWFQRVLRIRYAVIPTSMLNL